jgi:hypothetical protein
LAVNVSPTISTQPTNVSVVLGQAAVFNVAAFAWPAPTYQWQKNGISIVGATGATLTLNSAQLSDSGVYSVVVTNSVGSVVSNGATLTVNLGTLPVLVNLSVLKQVNSFGMSALFTITGSTPKTVLIRAIGPTLGAAPFNIGGAMPDPRLDLVNLATGAIVAANDDWGGSAQIVQLGTSVGAFALSTAFSKDAVVAATLTPGTYEARLSGVGGSAGLVLLEIYDADGSRTSALTYLALRTSLSAGETVTLGTVLGGTGTSGVRSLFVRALGPSLGLSTALSDPTLTVFSGQTVIGSNDNWGGSASIANAVAAAGALPFSSATSKDSAVFLSAISSGGHSAQVSGLGGAAGDIVVEIMDNTIGAVSAAPIILTPPVSQSVVAGASAVVSVNAAGIAPLTYQWRKNGTRSRVLQTRHSHFRRVSSQMRPTTM